MKDNKTTVIGDDLHVRVICFTRLPVNGIGGRQRCLDHITNFTIVFSSNWTLHMLGIWGTWCACIYLPSLLFIPFAHIMHLWFYITFIPYRCLLFLLLEPASTMGHLLYGSSPLGSCVSFQVPILKEWRTFEIYLHCNGYSWRSLTMCAYGCQCGVWIWHIVFFTHGVPSSCTRCEFLHWWIVRRIWSCHIRNSAGTCYLGVGEGRLSLKLVLCPDLWYHVCAVSWRSGNVLSFMHNDLKYIYTAMVIVDTNFEAHNNLCHRNKHHYFSSTLYLHPPFYTACHKEDEEGKWGTSSVSSTPKNSWASTVYTSTQYYQLSFICIDIGNSELKKTIVSRLPLVWGDR